MSSSDIQSTSSIKKQRRFPRFRWNRGNFFTSFRRCRSSKNKDLNIEAGSKTPSISEDSNNPENSSKKDIVALNNSFDTDNSRRKSLQSSGVSVGSKYSVSSRSGINSVLECPLCLVTQPVEKFPQLTTCQHRSCQDCLRQYLSIEITESRVNLMCPECQEKLHPSDMREILKQDPHLLVKWEEFTLRRTLSVDPDCRWCPAPDCGYAVIAFGCASCPKLECKRPGCSTEFCYHCRQEWHPTQTCDSAHLQRTKQLRIRSNSVAYSQGSGFHDEIKPCPKCGALIVKMNDGSCNHMTCTVCEAEFCWLCLQEITDLHYLSPSGCTFWGKKPWSRKKKILWQLGLLVGAPLGIGLVACLAVPAIIVGLPIWVARRIIAQFDEDRDVATYKRNLLVATCVAGSIVLSPALAALAVGVGVPVMLLYVYGVVPFSLCRTGTYRLPTYAPGGSGMPTLPMGFRIDLGGQSGQHGVTSPDGDVPSGSLNARMGGINPSIGEASVGGMTMGSLNLSHDSNLDKAGRLDPDIASTVAIAGASITGSISGISGQNGSYKIDLYPTSGKEADQQSTQGSVGSGSNFTSVQVHMSDNVSENSTTGHMNNVLPVKKSYSSRSLGAKRKTRHSKRSSMKDRGKNGVDSHGLPPVDDSPTLNDKVQNSFQSSTATTVEIPESENVENLPQITAKETDCKLGQTAEESGSDVSSCGSQTALITTISQQTSLTKPTVITIEQPTS